MWFDAATGNMLGGILGASMGVICGLWGTIAGKYASKGKFRQSVSYSAKLIIAVGILLSLAGGIAIIADQPRHVWSPFLLCGIIPLVVMLSVYSNIKRAYAASELKKMYIDDMK